GVGALQSPSPQASHSDVAELTHAEPLRGARHRLAFLLMLARVRPLALVRQHATAPGRPQVERDAHCTTRPRQRLLLSAARAALRAQRTYAPWFGAPSQSHAASIAARAAAMSAASAPSGSQAPQAATEEPRTR